MDACGGIGQVTGLNPAGDNFLNLRSAPGLQGAVLERLGPGRRLIVCDEDDTGLWLGVIVDDGLDCRIADRVPQRVAYRGPCRSGWVFARYVTLLAG
jgi:hypothetical protein